VLRDSLVREITHKATCGACRRPAPFFSRRTFDARALPPVLAVHACVANEEQLAVWRDSRKATFLSPEVAIRGHSEAPAEANEADEVTYEIRVRRGRWCVEFGVLKNGQAIVVQIVTEKESHLVGIINGAS
jgi:PAB-dependent poly(A)-specific ribonuclease subunit 2